MIILELELKNKTDERYFYELKRFIKSGKSIDDFINENVKDKKQLSKLLCGLKLIDFDNKYNILKHVESYFTTKSKYYKLPEEQFKLRNIENAINRLKNKRLKIAYRLAIISGLRLSEISKLTINDIEVDTNDNRLTINVASGKGNKNRKVKCLPDKYILDALIDLEPRKNGKLFYCKKYLMDKGRALGFHMHDLRKTFANIKYYNNISDNVVVELQEDLGHCLNTKTYLKYLNRDINLNNTRWDNMKPLENERDML